jgi:hypothetical protein
MTSINPANLYKGPSL